MEHVCNFTGKLLSDVRIGGGTLVPLDRVIEQRLAFSELYTVALLQPSLDVVLGKAARTAAEGCRAPYAKVLEHKPGDGQFLLLAGWNLKPGYVGRLVG